MNETELKVRAALYLDERLEAFLKQRGEPHDKAAREVFMREMVDILPKTMEELNERLTAASLAEDDAADAAAQARGAELFAQFTQENPQYIYIADDPGPNEPRREWVLTPAILERWMKDHGYHCIVSRDGSYMRVRPLRERPWLHQMGFSIREVKP